MIKEYFINIISYVVDYIYKFSSIYYNDNQLLWNKKIRVKKSSKLLEIIVCIIISVFYILMWLSLAMSFIK